MSPDRHDDARFGEIPFEGEDRNPEERIRGLFEKCQPGLEAKASESMPQDLDALFENEITRASSDSDGRGVPSLEGEFATRLRDLFAGDLLQADRSEVGSPAHLDAATASELDRQVAEGIRRIGPKRTAPKRAPQPIPLLRGPSSAPKWAGLAAAGLLGMLYLWGQGYLGQDSEGQGPLFVLVDVEKPLNTNMDPGAISLAAAGAIDFIEGAATPAPPGVESPKKGGEE